MSEHEHNFVPVRVNFIWHENELTGKAEETENPLTVVSACHCGAVKTRFATPVGGKYDNEEPEEDVYPVSYTHLTLPTSDLV